MHCSRSGRRSPLCATGTREYSGPDHPDCRGHAAAGSRIRVRDSGLTGAGHSSVKVADSAPANTPNIDRLANSGQLFNNAISAYHSTTMSMASLFTGHTPSIESGSRENPLDWNTFVTCGMSRFATPGKVEACVPESMGTLAEDLQEAGYWTLGVVSNELLFRPGGYDQGFDEWVEVGLAEPGEVLNIFQASPIRTVKHVNHDALEALAKRPRDHFFLYLYYIDVHPEQGEYVPIRGLVVISVVDSMGRRNILASRS